MCALCCVRCCCCCCCCACGRSSIRPRDSSMRIIARPSLCASAVSASYCSESSRNYVSLLYNADLLNSTLFYSFLPPPPLHLLYYSFLLGKEYIWVFFLAAATFSSSSSSACAPTPLFAHSLLYASRTESNGTEPSRLVAFSYYLFCCGWDEAPKKKTIKKKKKEKRRRIHLGRRIQSPCPFDIIRSGTCFFASLFHSFPAAILYRTAQLQTMRSLYYRHLIQFRISICSTLFFLFIATSLENKIMRSNK